MQTLIDRTLPARQPHSASAGVPEATADPWWSRPGLIAVSVLAGVLVFWALTANGYANAWYANGALAASHSWKSLFENSADLSNLISLDKGPLPDWMMGLSGRIFGFDSFSMLLPDALCGIAAVIVLHDTVRRTLGHRAALLAALMLAVSPVSVMMDRYNNPEALLALLMVASAWALVRALESGHLRHMLLCGLFVGLAFETKMLAAYLVAPGLAVAFAVAGRGGWRRRLGHLVCGGVVMVVVSFAWFAVMMLLPVADRPYVSDTTDNSWFTLIFGFNGLSRLSAGGGGAVHLWAGVTRLFTGSGTGGQIGWLLLLALAGLLAGLWISRRSPREDRRRAAYLLFGLWGLAGFALFSFSQGIFHGYYTAAMAPAVAALASAGTVAILDRARGGWGWVAAGVAAVAATAAVSFTLLGDTPSFVPWLRWTVLGAAAIAAVRIVALRALPSRPPSPHAPHVARAMAGLAFSTTLVALLAGPTAYSIATVGHGQAAVIPTAGPGHTVDDFPANAALLAYLQAHRQGARYLLAANGTQVTAPLALAARAPVITIGGFDGSAAAPTVAQLESVVARGQLRYVMPGNLTADTAMRRWINSRCRQVLIPGDPASTVSRTEARILRAHRNGAKLLRSIRAALRAERAVYRCSPPGANGGSR
jgi:4-amino-4-deoxy-L-arabinose transferase-like glycosyltransferase